MLITKIQVANKQTRSLRTTIPAEVVEALGLSAGDAIAFDIDKKRVCFRR